MPKRAPSSKTRHELPEMCETATGYAGIQGSPERLGVQSGDIQCRNHRQALPKSTLFVVVVVVVVEEQKVDIRVIQVMLGHKKLETVYTHVATEILHEVVSPLEKLQPA